MKEITELMCHPLCSCDNCEKLLANKRKDPSAVTIFSRDDIGATALHQAGEFGCEEIIYELIKKGGVVNATNYHGSTPLHLACQRGHHRGALVLVHYGADINATDNGYNSPLQLAVANGHESCVTYLCSSECQIDAIKSLDVDAQNEHGDTALHIASRWGFGNLVRILLKIGASIELENKLGMTPRKCALNLKIQEILLNGTNDEAKEEGYIYLPPVDDPPSHSISEFTNETNPLKLNTPNTSRRKEEFSRLLKAVSDGDIELVRHKLGLNIENEGTIEDPDEGKIEELLCHPLCQCEKCAVLQRKVVSESVTLTANMSNNDGVSALHVAALHGYEKIVGLLLKRAGADPNVKTRTNLRTPLHLACQYNNIESVSLLLKNGARTNLRDAYGNTSLHFCCTNGHIGPAILLLQSGANVNSINQRGNTPLHDAARWNFVDIARLLIYYKAPIDVKNKMQLSPLQYATGEDVQKLLETAAKKVFQEGTEDNDDDFVRRATARSLSFKDTSPKDEQLFSDSLRTKNDKKGVSIDSKSATLTENLHYDQENASSSAITDDQKKLPLLDLSKEDSRTNYNALLNRKIHSRRTTVNDLFEALEQESLVKMKQIARGIQTFDRRTSLRRVSTNDKSSLYFEQHYKTMVCIQTFDQRRLKRISAANTEESNSDSSSQNSVLPMVGSAAGSVDSSIGVVYNTDLALKDDNLLQTFDSTPEQSPRNSPSQFEEWFDNEIATDSADEATECPPHFNVDCSNNLQLEHSSTCSHENERIERLLGEAIDDNERRRASIPSIVDGVSQVLVEDDDLFVPRLI